MSQQLNFPNLAKKIDIQIQEVHRVPNKMNPKKPTPRYIIIKMPKVKERERICPGWCGSVD